MIQARFAVSNTRKEFEGDYTIVMFPFVPGAKLGPEQIGNQVGQYLMDHTDLIKSFNVIKGFLNVELRVQWWFDFIDTTLLKTIMAICQRPTKKSYLNIALPIPTNRCIWGIFATFYWVGLALEY